MTSFDNQLLRILADDAYLFDGTVPFLEKHYAFKYWLHTWERYNLPMLRQMNIPISKYKGQITLIFYSFPKDQADFDTHEFSILHTWRMLGKIPVSIIADRLTDRLKVFQEQYAGFVEIRLTKSLVSGNIKSMSIDCMNNLFRYFNTPYCLIIQDDGFPIRDNLDEFLNGWDYLGAPCVKDSFRQHIADFLLRDILNGGVSLRSQRYCRAVSLNWRLWGRLYAKLRGLGPEEDRLYVCMSRLNPWMRVRYRIPGAQIARRFSFFDLLGGFDARQLTTKPFGLHGQSTIWQFRQTMCELGYDLITPFKKFYQ